MEACSTGQAPALQTGTACEDRDAEAKLLTAVTDANVIGVAKIVIEQLWSNRWQAGPWPGWWIGYGWLLFVN